MKCHVCGHTVAKPELVSEVFNLDGRRVLVERIPALACEHCGEVTLSRETTERVRRLVHGEGQPIKTISMDVFAMTVRDSRAGRIEKQVIAIRFTI
ncbi:MAG: YgiT-type zinc finger domain-containing protein [Verrucomicrobia bacterium]|nr:MAG: YgiT-type zinc finger domain-containing protein [Verrucomicrobiota bacterium]